jgi:hypothetical protein
MKLGVENLVPSWATEFIIPVLPLPLVDME